MVVALLCLSWCLTLAARRAGSELRQPRSPPRRGLDGLPITEPPPICIHVSPPILYNLRRPCTVQRPTSLQAERSGEEEGRRERRAPQVGGWATVRNREPPCTTTYCTTTEYSRTREVPCSTSSAFLTFLSLSVNAALFLALQYTQQFFSDTMSSILASAAQVEHPLPEKGRLGPWLAAWHDPVAGLTCNVGCMQVRCIHRQHTFIVCGRQTRVSYTSSIASNVSRWFRQPFPWKVPFFP